MRCKRCDYENEETVEYCARCGTHIVYRRDQVQEVLRVKLETQMADSLEEQMRHFMVLSGALLLGAITFKLFFSGWATCFVMPSSSQSAPYATVNYTFEAPIDPIKPPLHRPK